MEDTHHGFYLLVPQVGHQSTAVVDEVGGVAQEGVDGHLGGHPDVGQGEAAPWSIPFADVHQPFGGGGCLKQIAKLKFNTNLV